MYLLNFWLECQNLKNLIQKLPAILMIYETFRLISMKWKFPSPFLNPKSETFVCLSRCLFFKKYNHHLMGSVILHCVKEYKLLCLAILSSRVLDLHSMFFTLAFFKCILTYANVHLNRIVAPRVSIVVNAVSCMLISFKWLNNKWRQKSCHIYFKCSFLSSKNLTIEL